LRGAESGEKRTRDMAYSSYREAVRSCRVSHENLSVSISADTEHSHLAEPVCRAEPHLLDPVDERRGQSQRLWSAALYSRL
jgi:hypothetical protein